MRAQTGRLIRAILAWPLGAGLGFAYMFLPTLVGPSNDCAELAKAATDPTTCAIEDPAARLPVALVIALVPAFLATRAWWNGRRGAN